MPFRTNARLAGSAFLIYIAAGIGSMALPADRRAVLATLMALSALTLGTTLYALTRDVARDLALLAMLCRVLEAAAGNGEVYFAIASTIFSAPRSSRSRFARRSRRFKGRAQTNL